MNDEDVKNDDAASHPGLTLRPSKSKGLGKKMLLVLGVLLLAGGAAAAGWYYQQQTVKELRQQIEQLKAEKTALANQPKSEDAPTNWPDYVSQSGKFRLKYKPGWLALVCEGNLETVFLAPDEESQALCASEKFSPVSFGSREDNHRSLDATEIDTYASDVQVSEVTIDGKSGKKATYTHDGNEFVAKDTKFIQYEFFITNRTYFASYAQVPNDQDLSADFEAMVKTWQFSIN